MQNLNCAVLINYLSKLLLIDLILGDELNAVNVNSIRVELRNGFEVDLNVLVRKHTVVSADGLGLILFLQFW